MALAKVAQLSRDDQNRLTGVTPSGGSTTDQYFDNNGNTLTGSTGQTYTYDAWNHIITADVDGTTVTYGYDALGQRITSQSADYSYPQGTVEIYDAEGQVIETDEPGSDEPKTGSVTGWMIYQNVWGLGNVNDLVVRDDRYSDPETSGATRRLYAVHDANWDVTAIADSSSGDVLQWFGYRAYGQQYVFDSDYKSITDGYNWKIGFHGGMKDPVTGLVTFKLGI